MLWACIPSVMVTQTVGRFRVVPRIDHFSPSVSFCSAYSAPFSTVSGCTRTVGVAWVRDFGGSRYLAHRFEVIQEWVVSRFRLLFVYDEPALTWNRLKSYAEHVRAKLTRCIGAHVNKHTILVRPRTSRTPASGVAPCLPTSILQYQPLHRNANLCNTVSTIVL